MWGGIITCSAVAWVLLQSQETEKKTMTNNLTTIASLPGSGGGCLSALPAEVGKESGWSVYCRRIAESNHRMTTLYGVQMKAPYFEEPDDLAFPPIDLGEIGGDGA